MAEPLKFQPKPPPDPEGDAARVELEALLHTLHTSGILRALRGILGQLPEVVQVAMDRVASDGGKNALSNLTIAAEALVELDAEMFHKLARGLTRGVSEAACGATARPPSVWQLLRGLQHPDARRGAFALVTVLRAVGAALRPEGATGAGALLRTNGAFPPAPPR